MSRRKRSSLTFSSSALWNAIGGSDNIVKPDIERFRLKGGDQLLLCTDVLTRYVDEVKLKETIIDATSMQQTCSKLIGFANESGGADNLTVIHASFEPVHQNDGS